MNVSTAAPETTQSEVDEHVSIMSVANMVEQFIERDTRYPDLADLIKGPTSDQYSKRVSIKEQDFVKEYSLSMPEHVAEMIDQFECRCFMGVLPEIRRAWVSVDNRLFLWNYLDENQPMNVYEDQDQIIASVGLVKPKPGIFGNHINYILVLATPVSIHLLGVSFTPGSTVSNELSLFGTNLVVSSDGVQMSHITGTDEGRIFVVGDDARLYEVDYKPPHRWFQRNCSLIPRTTGTWTKFLPVPFSSANTSEIASIAIDNERKVLYILRDQSTIEVVYLGEKGDQFNLVTTMKDIGNSARIACRSSSFTPDADYFRLKTIHAIPKSVSKKVHLVAVASTGARLYFTHHQNSFRMASMQTTADIPPNTLELIHVRLPPPVEAAGPSLVLQGQQDVSRKIYTAFYEFGTLLAAETTNQDKDLIWMVATELGDNLIQQQQITNSTGTAALFSSSQPSWVETTSVVESEGRIYAIAAANTHARSRTGNSINEISELLTDPRRQFVVLTAFGVTIFSKMRPVDILEQLVRDAHGDISSRQQEFVAFFEKYGHTQACAMCLAIICANFGTDNPEKVDIIRGATQLFFECGGTPKKTSQSAISSNHLGRAIDLGHTVFSGKHDGLALYLARLLTPVWKLKVFDTSVNSSIEESTRLQTVLLDAQRGLIRLKNFMDVNPHFHVSAHLGDTKFRSTDHDMLRVLVHEQQSVHWLYRLVIQCIEAISFLDFLLDASVQDILRCVSEASRPEIVNLTLETMLATPRGRVLIRELVIAAINKYGTSHTHVGFDVVSDMLRRKCSSFFGPSDVAFYRGVENVRRAQTTESEYERAAALNESLELFKQAADYLTDEKLGEICAEYCRQGYHIGSVKLPLERAKRIDPEGQAQPAPIEGKPADDSRVQLYEARMRCYRHVFNALSKVKKILDSGGKVEEGQRLPMTKNPHAYASEVFAAALSYPDKLFHYSLYRWYMDNDMKNELLSVESEYLKPFFTEHLDEVTGMDFMWQYYRHREKYFEAALYLEALATRSNNGLPLVKRLKYLALAVVNARCRDPERLELQEALQLLQSLEERVAIGRIQYRIQQALLSRGLEEDARRLDGELLNLSDLFHGYAKKYDIKEEMESILQLAGY